MVSSSSAWSRRLAWGTVVVAGLAAMAQATTVLVAYRGAQAAETTIVRGEGDAMLATIREEFRAHEPTTELLASMLSRGREVGLRCVAVLGETTLLAGDPGCATPMRPGVVEIRGGLARLAAPMPPPRREGEDDGPPRRGWPPPLIVLGFAPSVTVGLRTDLGRVAWVGGGAAALLLGVALALTRTAIARSRLEQEAERQKRLVALGQMSSVMAHELRNPLASLKGHAQLLVESLGEGSRERAKAERVVREAERIERLTVDLLDFVRDGPIDLRPVTPAALIERARELVPEAEIRLDLTGAPPALEVDPARLAAALGNLLRNARQASDQPAEVRVLTRADAVIIEVQDRGPGLPPGEEERIFDPFVTGRTWGTGLGLAVARRAAEQHGGTLRGETHPAGGALFRVTLPGAARTT